MYWGLSSLIKVAMITHAEDWSCTVLLHGTGQFNPGLVGICARSVNGPYHSKYADPDSTPHIYGRRIGPHACLGHLPCFRIISCRSHIKLVNNWAITVALANLHHHAATKCRMKLWLPFNTNLSKLVNVTSSIFPQSMNHSVLSGAPAWRATFSCASKSGKNYLLQSHTQR